MKSNYTTLRGVRDILPEELSLWRKIESKARDIFTLYNYREIETPILEFAEIFTRSVGEETDIVRKEMYTFKDRGDRLVALRPEGTAPVVRAYLQNKLYIQGKVTKLFYMGPMFRYDRPQAGRQREFHQIGIEAIGDSSYILDAEVISLLWIFLKSIGLDKVTFLLNSVGCPICRPRYKEALVDYFKPHREELCDDCKIRLEKNPLRILDCKVESCKKVSSNVPSVLDYLCEECSTHFAKVRGLLDRMNISYVVDPTLVRGLDYYTKTAFEVVADGSGLSVGGGGRYDGLVEELGGPPIPGIGFAIGMERLMGVLSSRGLVFSDDVAPYYFIVYDIELADESLVLANALREKGFVVDLSFSIKSIKAQMRESDRSKARYTIILRKDLWSEDRIIIKDMATGEQRELYKKELEVL
ncbi:MAG: histidine--tRNA ligase [bacterium]